MSTLYYVYPFGQNADDLTAIPTPAAGDGSVSYFAGWTDPYEQNLLTNPSALPIPRGQMNQLFYDITNNIQQYQQVGTPNWISSADNLGSPYPYGKYSRILYTDGKLYESQAATNTSTPGASSTWLLASAGALYAAMQSGTAIYAADTSVSANTVTVAPAPAYAAYTAGTILSVLINNTNTGASTVNINGLGSKAIKKETDTGLVDLSENDMQANGLSWMQYDGTQFQLLNPMSQGEYLSSNVPFASSVSLTTLTGANVTSMVVPAGKWKIGGNVYGHPSAQFDSFQCWANTVSATPVDKSLIAIASSSALVGDSGLVVPEQVLTFASPTTVYLSCVAQFGSGTGVACGQLNAERVY